MIRLKSKGDFKNAEKFLEKASKPINKSIFDKYGEEGVIALQSNTPVASGLTASSWSYKINQNGTKTIIEWNNSNIKGGVSIAVILQYGHGTKNGGYVQGRDYINPALRPVFERISEEAWKEVIK